MEKPNLLWKTITYCPGILFALEATSTGLRTSLCHDLSHVHYFLESQFRFTHVRDSDFKCCKNLLKSELVDSGLLFYMTLLNPHSSPEFVSQLKSFDCYT